MSPSLVTNNGDVATVKTAPVAGRLAAVYSEVQTSRIDHALPLPSVLRNPFKIVDGPPSSAAGNPGSSLLSLTLLFLLVFVFDPFLIYLNLHASKAAVFSSVH